MQCPVGQRKWRRIAQKDSAKDQKAATFKRFMKTVEKVVEFGTDKFESCCIPMLP